MALIKTVFLLVIATVITAFLLFYLPSQDIVRIVGTDVKRMDVQGKDFVSEGGTSTSAITRDVRYIYAAWPDGSARVYRNEDTSWGFPWYFKFDTSNMQSAAEDIKSTPENPKWVVVKHYGWRSTILTWFPNAIKITPIDNPNKVLIPWFNIILLTLIFVIFFVIYRVIVEARKKHVDPLIDRLEEEAEEAYGHTSGFRKWLGTWRGKARK